MLLEVLTIARDRLTDPVTGVTALLATVPRPSDAPALPDVQIVTELDRPTAVLGPVDDALLAEYPAGSALLLVSIEHDAVLPVQIGVKGHEAAAAGEAVVPITVKYVPPRGADARTAAYGGLLTLRCAARALVAPSATGGQAAQQQLVQRAAVRAPATVQFLPPSPDVAGQRFIPALLVPFLARDPWVLGVA